jgi:hypothetical protein
MFEPSVQGAYGREYVRSSTHLTCCPTDQQAEVLIPDRIELDDIMTIAVASRTQVKNELARFRLMRVPEDSFKFIIVPVFFDKRRLSTYITSGRRPPETPWKPGEI